LLIGRGAVDAALCGVAKAALDEHQEHEEAFAKASVAFEDIGGDDLRVIFNGGVEGVIEEELSAWAGKEGEVA
jgi:hypothetical protein